LFDKNFDAAKASPLVANQRLVLIAALGAALEIDRLVDDALAALVREHRARLQSDMSFMLASGFTAALLERATANLQAGRADAALGWARCVYVIARRVAHGWLPLLNFVIATGIYRRAGVLPAQHGLIARGRRPPIPRRIIQYWDQPAPPLDVAAMIESWRGAKGFFHRLVDHKQARSYLDRHYGGRVLAAYDRATHAAGKADVFRLAWLYQRGGIYADADERLVGQVDQMLPEDCRLLLTWAEGTPPCIQNGFIAAQPLNAVIERALMLAVKRVEHATRAGEKMNAWLQTGPGVMSMAVLDDFAIHGRPVATRGLYLMDDPVHRGVVQSDEFLEYRKHPAGNWRLER
jgi:hypothetical protein